MQLLKLIADPHKIEQIRDMKGYKHKAGLTLIETLIVVAIVALLATMVIAIATRIGSKTNEQLTENTIAIINAALGQFQDYGYNYKVPSTVPPDVRDFYLNLDFPVDCNDFDKSELQTALEDALDERPMPISGGTHKIEYSGSEALYFFLSRVPTSRKTLDAIDKSLITSEGSDKQDIKITIAGKDYPLIRVIDPWGETLRYDYYDEDETDFDDREKTKRNFPLITSAGPDRKFGTGDDISNR